MLGSILLAVLVQTMSPSTKPNELTGAERVAGWRLLFDGRTLTGWRGLGYDTVPTAHWRIVDGTIKKIASGNRSEEHTSELQSRLHLVCRLLLEKKKDRGTRRPKLPWSMPQSSARD